MITAVQTWQTTYCDGEILGIIEKKKKKKSSDFCGEWTIHNCDRGVMYRCDENSPMPTVNHWSNVMTNAWPHIAEYLAFSSYCSDTVLFSFHSSAKKILRGNRGAPKAAESIFENQSKKKSVHRISFKGLKTGGRSVFHLMGTIKKDHRNLEDNFLVYLWDLRFISDAFLKPWKGNFFPTASYLWLSTTTTWRRTWTWQDARPRTRNELSPVTLACLESRSDSHSNELCFRRRVAATLPQITNVTTVTLKSHTEEVKLV